MTLRVIVALAWALPGLVPRCEAQFFKLPKVAAAPEYGNILMDRMSSRKGKPPVSFSHWSHRTRYTCRVCHYELEFEMAVNATEITENKNRFGEYCGACHNGKIAFGHTRRNCKRCHNGDITQGTDKFGQLSSLPRAKFGNKIDWDAALEAGLIKPKASLLEKDYKPMGFDKTINLEAGWTMIPAARFSHRSHNRWLDCANCHPDIFNIKKKGTKDFAMKYILEGRFCGTCHLGVAFPLDDCKRCHPGMH